MEIEIEIVNRQRKIKISKSRVKKTVKRIIYFLIEQEEPKLFRILKKEKGLKRISVSVVVVGEKKMKELNFKYRGKNKTTDVLSFSYLDRIAEDLFLGEIFIDIKRADYQAKKYGLTRWQELTRLLIHGVLHLIGYDHEKNLYQAKKMQKLEQKIFNYLKP